MTNYYKFKTFCKNILFAVSGIIIAISLCACHIEKSQVFYNKYPFNEKTILDNTNVFSPGERIYYLITLPEHVKSQRLYIQILQAGGTNRLGYEMVWAKQVKIRDEQYHYYTDYIVLHQAGTYIINVYSKDEPTKLLTTSEFYLK